jgi:ABC-type branched-subunit amino acid transport system substrate-binding protein
MESVLSRAVRADGWRSLVAIVATAGLAAVHRYARLEPGLMWTLAAGVILPLLCHVAFLRTLQRSLLLIYGVASSGVIVALGFIEGGWHGLFKIYLGNFLAMRHAQYFSWRTVDSFPREAAGILAFVCSLYALFFLLRYLRGVASFSPRGSPGWRMPMPLPAMAVATMSVLLVVQLAAAGWTERRQRPAERETIRIGVIVPRSGPVAALGTAFVEAVEMARTDTHGTKHRYEIVVADAGSNPIQAQAAIKKLLGQERVDAVVGGISLLGQMVQPYANLAHVPHICVCTVPSIGDNRYNFTNIPLAEDEAVRWTSEALRRGIRSVALLTQAYPSIDGHLDALRAQLPKDGITIVHQHRFPASTTDFSAIVANARAARSDVYFVEAPEPALSQLAQSLRSAGVTSIASVVAPSVSERPELLEGAWYTDSNLVNLQLKERFVRKNPGKPFPTHMVPYAYDSFRLLVSGFEKDGDATGYLRQLTAYEGQAGPVTKRPGTGNFRSKPAVWTIHNAQPMLLAQS